MRIHIIVAFLFIWVFYCSCSKVNNRRPIISTSAISNVGLQGAQGGGVLYKEGDDNVTEKGICWGETMDPQISDHKNIAGKGSGNFSCEISGIKENRTYYVRAYAINKFGISYGKSVSFSTSLVLLPSILIGNSTIISANAIFFDVLIGDTYSAEVTTKGFYWSTNPTPSNQDYSQVVTSNSLNYQAKLEDLTPETMYYIRAFVSSKLGTRYSEQKSFKTKPALHMVSYSVSLNGAVFKAEVDDANTGEITALGICWSKSPLPSINDNKTGQNFSSTLFSESLTGLDPETTYYVRAYLLNNKGVYYSEQVEITTYGTMTDIDGNKYNTVKIGTQIWMTSNLKVSHFNDGSAISYVTNGNEWYNNNNQNRSMYCYYNNNVSNNQVYGKLYNWFALTDPKKLAPAGWRIPTEDDLRTLLSGQNCLTLRSTDGYWTNNDSGFPTNTSGFSAQPGGYRDYQGAFDQKGGLAYFTSSTESGWHVNSCLTVGNRDDNTAMGQISTGSGMSVRCIKN